MNFCHSEIDRPYFVSIGGRYEVGPLSATAGTAMTLT